MLIIKFTESWYVSTNKVVAHISMAKYQWYCNSRWAASVLWHLKTTLSSFCLNNDRSKSHRKAKKTSSSYRLALTTLMAPSRSLRRLPMPVIMINMALNLITIYWLDSFQRNIVNGQLAGGNSTRSYLVIANTLRYGGNNDRPRDRLARWYDNLCLWLI